MSDEIEQTRAGGESARRCLSDAKRELINANRFCDEAEAPAVDLELLSRYLNDDLPVEIDQRVELCLRRYQSWVTALAKLEESRSDHPPRDHSPS